ncbi:hypothetical protein FIV00_22735 [Labrenzia sp. THAF82]|uniref:Hint domain-containing protein n=1 Tax=Labrenzia sp. THAF82 TaxID=2587861 RepID=UPI0012682978|nr:Hint domain-containing protein [Labrenzia sp. THAF82]QFT33325.1 hypothetical protein FIV00_22735 [Labrenzia sp. THAF82]
MTDYAIPIVWTNYPIATPSGPAVGGLGHAGVVIVQGSTGNTRYFEFGRYGRDEKDNPIGKVQSHGVSDLRIVDGKIDGTSFQNMVSRLNEVAGKGTPATGTILPLDEGGYQRALEFATRALRDADGTLGPYSWEFDNHCYSFAKAVAAHGGSWIDWFDGFGPFDNIPTGAMLNLMSAKGGFVVGSHKDVLIGSANSYISALPDKCFSGSTSILTIDDEIKPIRKICIGDVVLSFDPFADFGRGFLVPKKVVRTFTNITEEWLRLTWVEDGAERELVTTPSHQFLATHGGFREIESLVSGGKGRVVLADGSEAEVTSERIVYCAATADMFEQAEGYAYPENGNLALKPVFKQGWKTYNFEVEDFHTYVAGGVRVHNDSWNDGAGFEFQKEDYGTGNAYAITDLEGIVPVNGYAVTAYRLSQNSSYDSMPQGRAEAVAFGAAAEGASNRQVNAASWSEYKAKSTEGLSDKAAAAWTTAHWSAKEFSRFEASIKHGRDQGREVAKQINDQNDRNSGRDSEGSRADSSRSSNPADRGIGRGDYDNDGEVSAREFRRAENEGQFETGNKAKNNDSDGNSGGNGGSGGKPVLLDLDGDGLDVTALDRSTIFLDTGGDGFLRRTAWADAGDGVLFYDPDGRDGITEKRQFVFTEWDPTATSDLEALASVFDSNSDGVLDAGDAEFGKFKVLVTLADGSTVAKTLAELGITAIDLTAAAANSDLRLAA